MLTTQLFTAITSSDSYLFKEMEKPILVSQFSTNGNDITLMLTDNFIILCQNSFTKIPTHFLPLTFTVKFQTLFQTFNATTVGVHIPTNSQQQPQLDFSRPLGICLQREECSQKITFFSQYMNVVDLWIQELEKKINQRNFHKLFKAKKKIGKGAFATVYLAERLKDKKMVAVKAFSKEKQYAGDKGRDSLQNEINLMRLINHNSIMRLQAVFETDNSIYVILQYLQGVQLNQILKSNKLLTIQEKCSIIRCILKGLQYLSDHRIIHRDLKPENIMFRKQDSTDAVICDFGLATLADIDKYLFVRCGTPGFVSPQIINIKDMSTKSEPISDVFSAGLIFHYLLFGNSIFTGKKYNEILSQNRACDFDFSEQKYQDVSPLALDLLKKMLEKDPSRRVSAKKALQHTFFNSGSSRMDIEQPSDKRSPFKQLTYNSYMKGGKSPNENILVTPSSRSMTPSNQSRFSFSSQMQRQENRRIY